MNLLGYDAAAIGNHEFNYGIEHLDAVVRQADFPFLSANVFRAGTDEHAYRAVHDRGADGRRAPLRIGITAVTPPGVALWDRDNVRGKPGLPRDRAERAAGGARRCGRGAPTW